MKKLVVPSRASTALQSDSSPSLHDELCPIPYLQVRPAEFVPHLQPHFGGGGGDGGGGDGDGGGGDGDGGGGDENVGCHEQ